MRNNHDCWLLQRDNCHCSFYFWREITVTTGFGRDITVATGFWREITVTTDFWREIKGTIWRCHWEPILTECSNTNMNVMRVCRNNMGLIVTILTMLPIRSRPYTPLWTQHGMWDTTGDTLLVVLKWQYTNSFYNESRLVHFYYDNILVHFIMTVYWSSWHSTGPFYHGSILVLMIFYWSILSWQYTVLVTFYW